MPDAVVTVDRRDDGVAVVRLDNPKVNALSTRVLSELERAALDLTDSPPGAVVITGGDRVFAAGADISEFQSGDPAAIGQQFLRSLNAVAAIPRVTIAAVSGYALGGGCELALACDFRIASERAKFGQPEILLGIIPGGGGTQRLSRLIGTARAKDMILTGRQVAADEALRVGLVDEVVPAEVLGERALARAVEFASGPVLAHAMAKKAIDLGLDGTLEQGLELEQELFAGVFRTDDATTGVRSFLEHGPGKAEFEGR